MERAAHYGRQVAPGQPGVAEVYERRYALLGTMMLPHTSRRTFLRQIAAVSALSFSRNGVFGVEQVPGEGALRAAMDRAAKCCLAWLNPEAEWLPTGGYEVAHDTGRWWDAMLRYEAVTGVRLPEREEQAMMKNLRALTDNPAALLMNARGLPIPPEKIKVNPHNLRETMLAYTALVRFRQSDWARSRGHALLETIEATLEPDGQMDYQKLASVAGGPLTADPLVTQRAPAGEWFNATATTGRAIEAIVWFHEATNDALALKLAERLAKVHLRQSIDPEGDIRAELRNPDHVGHTHSYCGTLRGLLLFGLASGEKRYVNAVAATYRRGLWGTAISHSGWTPHDQGKSRFHGPEGDPVAEHASCGDVAQMALWLALRAGQTDLLDDVERLIRARLLPSQMSDPQQPRRDGAWGVYAHPFGYGAILDVFAAVLHSLADVREQIVATTAAGEVSVNLHFDRDLPPVKVTAARDQKATLTVLPKESCALRVRVPSWAPRDSLQWTVTDQPLPMNWEGAYLTLARKDVVAGRLITLRYDLPLHQTTEEMPVSHRKFQLSWQGNEVISCEPKVPIYSSR